MMCLKLFCELFVVTFLIVLLLYTRLALLKSKTAYCHGGNEENEENSCIDCAYNAYIHEIT